jgi:hypothetical protein
MKTSSIEQTETSVNGSGGTDTKKVVTTNHIYKQPRLSFTIEPLEGKIWAIDNLTLNEYRLKDWISIHCSVGTNDIVLNHVTKEIAAKTLKLNVRTIEGLIVSLSKKFFIWRIAIGHYKVNPYYSWRGDLAERRELIKKLKKKNTAFKSFCESMRASVSESVSEINEADTSADLTENENENENELNEN